MTATLLHLARALWWALTRGLRRALLAYELWELEAWMADCARDGLHHSLHMQRCRARAGELRTAMALLQPPLRRQQENA